MDRLPEWYLKCKKKNGEYGILFSIEIIWIPNTNTTIWSNYSNSIQIPNYLSHPDHMFIWKLCPIPQYFAQPLLVMFVTFRYSKLNLGFWESTLKNEKLNWLFFAKFIGKYRAYQKVSSKGTLFLVRPVHVFRSQLIFINIMENSMKIASLQPSVTAI